MSDDFEFEEPAIVSANDAPTEEESAPVEETQYPSEWPFYRIALVSAAMVLGSSYLQINQV